MEEWRTIKDYENYEVSNLGNIRNSNKKILKQMNDKDGYKLINLYKEKKIKTHRVHILVAKAFLNNPNNFHIINHKNELKFDNRVENLEWCTAQYNNTCGTVLKRRIETQQCKFAQYDLKGNLIAIHKGMQKFCKENNYSLSLISQVCNHRNGRKTAYGYKWEFYNQDNTVPRHRQISM